MGTSSARHNRRASVRFVVFALLPTFALAAAAELTLRVKYFVSHQYDWGYLVTPFGRGSRDAPDPFHYVSRPAVAASTVATPTNAPPAGALQAQHPLANPAPPQRSAAAAPSAPASRASTPSAAPFTGAKEATSRPAEQGHAAVESRAPLAPAPDVTTSPSTVSAPTSATGLAPATAPAHGLAPQMVFAWQRPCTSGVVFSTELQKDMPRSWNADCFRGDTVAQLKPPDEYRIFVMGGSTVEDAQSDDEMWTMQLKRALPPTRNGKRVTVTNAGRAGFEASRLLQYWYGKIAHFSPDLVVYYEAWNEQPTDIKWTRVDRRIATVSNWLHQKLYYRSMFYTYLFEKYEFMATSNERFWKIDVDWSRRNFAGVIGAIPGSGARLVFVTQVIRFPRYWKGIDTFDRDAVERLIDRLRGDRAYQYDVAEISALNQRLAVLDEARMCRERGVPVIDILDHIERLGPDGRGAMFVDLGHLSVQGDRIVGRLVAEGLQRLDGALGR